MVSQMHSETDAEFTPKISRNQTLSDLKNHDSAWEGHQFSWNPRISKTSPFWYLIGGIFELLDTIFCSFTSLLRAPKRSGKKHQKDEKKINFGLQLGPRGGGPRSHFSSTFRPWGTLGRQNHLWAPPALQNGAPGPQKSPKYSPRSPKWLQNEVKMRLEI